MCASVLVYNTEHMVLAVSRKNDGSKWWLPSGKVEVKDIVKNDIILSLENAARRECKEETGYLPLYLEMFCSNTLPGLWGVVFINKYSGNDNNFKPEPGTQVRWMQINELNAFPSLLPSIIDQINNNYGKGF